MPSGDKAGEPSEQKPKRRSMRPSDLNFPTLTFPIVPLTTLIDPIWVKQLALLSQSIQQQRQLVTALPRVPVFDPSVFAQFTAVTHHLAQQQTLWAPILESFQLWQQNFLTSFQPLIEEATRWSKAYADARELLIPHGWLISPSLAASLAPRLLGAVEEHGESVIDPFMMAYCTPEALRQIVDGCYDRPSFARYRQVFEKALDAHQRGDPELAIPIWLIAIDGIFAAELDVQDIFSRLHTEKDQRTVQAKFGNQEPRATIEEGASDAVIRIMATLGRSKTGRGRRRRSRGILPRRHDILHGSVPEIGNSAYSARCILVLEHIHWCLEQIDEKRLKVETAARQSQ